MQIIAERLAAKMLEENMISADDKDWYIYSLQIVTEKIIGYSIILLAAVLFDCFFQTVGFLLVLSGIRKYCGGFHFKHFWSCFLFSVGSHLIFVLLYQRFRMDFTGISMLVTGVMCLGIFCIGAVNNQGIHWNQQELLVNTSLTRISILTIYGVMLGLMLAGIDASYLWFMGWGVCLSFCSLLAEKMMSLRNGKR